MGVLQKAVWKLQLLKEYEVIDVAKKPMAHPLE